MYRYFVIGHHTVMSSTTPYTSIKGFPFAMSVYNSKNKKTIPKSVFSAIEKDKFIEIKVHIDALMNSMSQVAIEEAIEIFIKMCIRRGGGDCVFVFRFNMPKFLIRFLSNISPIKEQHGNISSFLKKEIINPKNCYKSMEKVHHHLLDIPWNFTPIDVDGFEPLINTNDKKGTILDLGAGFGRNAMFLEQHGYDVHGIDISSSAIKRCKNLVSNPEKFHVSCATQLPFAKETFHYVVDIGCIHCLQDNEVSVAIDEIYRVLKPKGVIYSRIFKPRSAKWLSVQPFKTSKFGYTTEQVLQFFQNGFQANIWKQHSDINYIFAKKD